MVSNGHTHQLHMRAQIRYSCDENLCLYDATSAVLLGWTNVRVIGSYRYLWKMVGMVKYGQAYCAKKQAHFVSGYAASQPLR